MRSNPMGTEPQWEVILKFKKDIRDERFYTIFRVILQNSLKLIFDKFIKVIDFMYKIFIN